MPHPSLPFRGRVAPAVLNEKRGSEIAPLRARALIFTAMPQRLTRIEANRGGTAQPSSRALSTARRLTISANTRQDRPSTPPRLLEILADQLGAARSRRP